MRNKQEVFNELYERFEAGNIISVELQEEAHSHGIRIESVEDIVLQNEDGEDFDEG